MPFPLPGDLRNPGIKPRSPALQADSLPAEPQGKPKNTGVGSLSLLQWIFQTQESNQGLLHCTHILYQLSYEGSPTRQWGVVLKQVGHFIGFLCCCDKLPQTWCFKTTGETSPMVQWSGAHLPMQVWSLVRELTSYIVRGH